MSNAGIESRCHSVVSKDGTNITYESTGMGPSIVVVPGALGTSSDYTEFARLLSDRFTVHVINRRGRGGSGHQGSDYSVEKESEDLQAVCESTNAKFVFGQSYGGFVILETALRNAGFEKIALYEPGLAMDGHSIDMSWAPECQNEVDQGNYVAAFTTFIRGLNPPSRRIPRWILYIVVWFLVLFGGLNKKARLVGTTIREHAEVARLNNTYATRYSEIKTKTLVIAGGEARPTEHGYPANQLVKVMKGSTLITFPGLDHLAPEKRPEKIIKAVSDFFSASDSDEAVIAGSS